MSGMAQSWLFMLQRMMIFHSALILFLMLDHVYEGTDPMTPRFLFRENHNNIEHCIHWKCQSFLRDALFTAYVAKPQYYKMNIDILQLFSGLQKTVN